MQPDTERSRARDKLRAYYRTTQPTASSSLRQQTIPVTSTAGERRTKRGDAAQDIDSAAFEPKRYLKKVLTEHGVAGLLRVDNELVSQVRQIDGDMKTMVYENYSRFISASETIARMTQDAGFMDAEMAKLSQRVNGISTKTAAVNAQFAQRREQIQRLGREHRLLSSLQHLLGLPEQLGRFIDAGRFVDAARAWARTQPLLTHYRQLGVFAGVEQDGRQLMAGVERSIWDRWNHEQTGIAEGAECASLLVLLSPDRAAALAQDYLDIQGAKNRA
ncbi:hypothetical protein IWW52_005748, partial [Coemansia sp. RSA 2704]